MLETVAGYISVHVSGQGRNRLPGLRRKVLGATGEGALMWLLNVLLAATVRNDDSPDTVCTCPKCGGNMKATLLGGLGPTACIRCGKTIWKR